MQEDLGCEVVDATRRRSKLKKHRRNLCEYSTRLTDLLDEDGTLAFSSRESITKRFYTDLFRSSTPVSSPSIPAREEGTNNREVEELAYCPSSKSAAEKTFESTYHPAHLLLFYNLLTEIIITRI